MCIRTNESYIIQIISGDVVTKTFFFGMKHERRDGNGRMSAKITNNQINWNKVDQLGKIYQRQLNAHERKLVEEVNIQLQTALSMTRVQKISHSINQEYYIILFWDIL